MNLEMRNPLPVNPASEPLATPQSIAIGSPFKRVFYAVEAALLKLAGPAWESGRPPERWVVFGHAAVGDTLFLLPSWARLRQAYPKAHITYVSNPSAISRDLIPATGLFDEVLEIELRDDWSWRRSANERIQAGRFDAALFSLSAAVPYFQTALSRIPLRVGFRMEAAPVGAGTFWRLKRALVTGELSRRLLLNRSVMVSGEAENAVDRNLRLMGAIGLPAAVPENVPFPVTDAAKRYAYQALEPVRQGKLVAVHPGSASNPYFKIWHPEKLGRICRRIVEEGKGSCFLVGGSEDMPNAAAVCAAAGLEIPSFVGRCGLLETFAMISESDLFIGSDTGLAKAAIAQGVPCATIWGPTDPAELGAWKNPNRHLDIRTAVPCSPCVRLGMPFPKEPDGIDYRSCSHHDCLGRLDENEVWRRIAPEIFPSGYPAPEILK